jgi:proton-coupled amino acid transporter
MVAILIIYTPISWVRNIAKFSFTFLLGVILVFFTLFVVSIYAITLLVEQGGRGPDVVFFNQSGYLTTMGTCIYCFEGIGVIMPIM